MTTKRPTERVNFCYNRNDFYCKLGDAKVYSRNYRKGPIKSCTGCTRFSEESEEELTRTD